MLGTWLTTRAVYGFGALLLLIGLMFIITGVPVVRLEIGWTEIIGGSVAASAGCVVLVLGLFLARLEMLQQSLDRLMFADRPPVAAPEPEPVAEDAPVAPQPVHPPRPLPVHPLAPAAKRTQRPPAEVRPEPALAAAAHEDEERALPADPAAAPALTESAPALLHAEEEASHSPLVAPVVARDSARQRSSFLSSILPRRTPPAMSWRAPETPPVTPAPWRDLDPVPASSPEDVYAPLPERDAPPPLRRTVADLASEWDAEEGPTQPPARTMPQAPVTHSWLGQPRDPEPTHPEPTHPEPAHAEPAPYEPPHAELPYAEPASAIAEPAVVYESAAPHDEDPAPLDDNPGEQVRSADIHTLVPKGDAAVQPVVVGRYNAGAASYVMYSNGMIEVETEQGTHQFASMQELKAFIERRDTAARA